MPGPTSPSLDGVLLVEGPDDKHVVLHLCNRRPSFSVEKSSEDEHVVRLYPSQPTSAFSISDKGGIDQLLGAISLEIKTPSRKAIGILVDANNDLNTRWNDVTNRLRKANIQAPPSPQPTGTIIDGQPRVGIWLMPDNASTGELEDFVMQMIPEGDPVWPRAKRYIGEIPQADRKFPEGKTRRAELYAWLAAMENPRQMGSAIGSHDLKVDGHLCKNFLDWLKALFA